jgi:hypothetical protein
MSKNIVKILTRQRSAKAGGGLRRRGEGVPHAASACSSVRQRLHRHVRAGPAVHYSAIRLTERPRLPYA